MEPKTKTFGAAFKALGFAIRQALVETDAVFSTKGSVTLGAG